MRDQRISVLVVDDERFFREAIADILRAEGFETEACEDGEGALKLIANRPYAVAIVDVRMPGTDGIEVMRQLRAAHPAMRVIVLSEPSDQERVLEGLRSGACDYLAKPLHDEELVLAVRRAAGDHHIEHDYVRLRHQVEDLAGEFAEFQHDLASAEPPRETAVYEASVALVGRALGVEKVSLLLREPESGRLDVVAASGRDLAPAQMDPIEPGEGIAGRALEDATAVLIEDARNESHFAADLSPDRYRTHSFAIAPIVFGEQPLGLLCATDRVDPDPLHAADLAILRLIAAHIAPHIAEPVVGLPSEADPLDGHGHVDVAAELGEELAEELPEALSGNFDNALVEAPAEQASADPVDPPVAEGDAGQDAAVGGEEAPALDLAHDLANAASLVGEVATRDAELARRVCDAMVHEVEPERLVREALSAVEAALEADPASLYLIDNTTGELVMEGCGARGLRRDRDRLGIQQGLTASVLQRGQLVASADPTHDPRFDASVDTPSDGRPGPLLVLPVQIRGKTIGVARMHFSEGASVSARTGEVLVAVLSAAVRNVLLYRSLLDSIEEVALARREARS